MASESASAGTNYIMIFYIFEHLLGWKTFFQCEIIQGL